MLEIGYFSPAQNACVGSLRSENMEERKEGQLNAVCLRKIGEYLFGDVSNSKEFLKKMWNKT